MLKVNPLENFELLKPWKWFQRYRTATKLNKEDNEIQISTLIYSMGTEAKHFCMLFTFKGEMREDYDSVMTCFDAHFHQ